MLIFYNIHKCLHKYNPLCLSKRTHILQSLSKMSTEIKEQKININGQTINYLRVGEGPKTIFCLPGALGTIWSDFKPQIEGFDKRKFTTIVWDPPGYGNSRPSDRKFHSKFYETDADYAYEFMTKLGINTYSLLGWSDGGISGMLMASKYPENIEKLVIWGANSYILPEERDIYHKMRDFSKWSDKMKAPLVAMYTERGLEMLWNSWCDALIKMYDNGGDICSTCLQQIMCPTLILHGDKDPMLAAEHPQFLLSNIKKSKMHRFPEGKHNIHLRYSDEFNRLVAEFILR